MTTEEKEHSTLIHRRVAYHKIYRKNRDKYPLPFKKYVVHHIDGDKLNNDVSNLEIMTEEEHNKLHRYEYDEPDDVYIDGKGYLREGIVSAGPSDYDSNGRFPKITFGRVWLLLFVISIIGMLPILNDENPFRSLILGISYNTIEGAFAIMFLVLLGIAALYVYDILSV